VNAEHLPTISLWSRILRGGVSLSAFERFLLRTLAEHVPPDIATALRQQWRGLNLIQRNPDWQELNFYRIVWGRVDRRGLPKLPIRDGEVKLLSLSLRPGNEPELLHVNFWAMDGWFFNLNANRSLKPFRALPEVEVKAVERSYRSNLVNRGA
jgi:hypothetical protein